MWGWLRELHEVLREAEERRSVCNSCEVLKVELARERREKEMLLNHALSPKLESAPARDDESREPMPLIRQHIPWRVKQQELETEDRKQAARIMKEFEDRVNKTSGINTDELEKSIGIK